MTAIRKRLGRKAIVPNAKKELVDAGHKLEEFYDVERIPMEVKKSVAVDGEEQGKKGKKGGRRILLLRKSQKVVENQERRIKEREIAKERWQKRSKRC